MSTLLVRETPKVLHRYGHKTPEEGMTLLEAVAWVAGDQHSPHPQCCCPVLANFGRGWNCDGMRSSRECTQLLPYVERLVGTRSTRPVAFLRADMAKRWLIHEFAPAWLDLAGFNYHAEALRTATNRETLNTAATAARAARVDAETNDNHPSGSMALRACAGKAAYLAATTYRESTEAVTALSLADDAADVAVAAATWGPTPDADWARLQRDAARDTLEPTVQSLQLSAHDLFNEMINTGRPAR